MASSSIDTPHKLNSMVLCRHTDNLYYEAKIFKVFQNKKGETTYKIHYMGWNRRHDENITHLDSLARFLDHNPENIEAIRIQKENALAKQKILTKGSRKSGANVSETDLEPQSKQIKKESECEEDTGAFDRKKYVFPSKVASMLRDYNRTLSLPPKTTVDKIMEQYKKHHRGGYDMTLYEHYPNRVEYINNNCEYLKHDFNRNFLYFVTRDELPQFYEIFKKKRVTLRAKELTLKEFKDSYNDYNEDLHLEPGFNFCDTVGLIHFARFLKKFCDSVATHPSLFEQEALPLFIDVLKFSEQYTSEYL